MDENELQFRTAAFGGFQKQDVLSYLELVDKEHAERLAALQRELEDAKSSQAEDRTRLEELLSLVSGLKADKETLATAVTDRDLQLNAKDAALAEAEDRMEALKQQLVELQARVEAQRPIVDAYEGIKDRTAGMELEAHGRAQLIERTAKQRAQRAQNQLESWLKEVSGHYQELHQQLDDAVAQTFQALSKIEGQLTSLPDAFATQDAALRKLNESIQGVDPTQPISQAATPVQPVTPVQPAAPLTGKHSAGLTLEGAGFKKSDLF